MKINNQLHVLGMLFPVFSVVSANATEVQNQKPNIILILADDMGYSDIGCYGSEIHTPNLDSLAEVGIRYTRFYNCARSCPSRASLLTGLYPHQTGIGNMVIDQGADAYRGDLNNQCITIAEALHNAGYLTYMSGKWHLTKYTDVFKTNLPKGQRGRYEEIKNWPLQRGFDYFYGTIHGAGSYFDPATLVEGEKPITKFPNDFYYTDAISQKAIDYISQHKQNSSDKPFFCYVAYTAPHWPLHALPGDIEKYKGYYKEGWDVVREKRYEKMQELGILNPKCKLSQRAESVPSWEDESEKAYMQRAMEIYAAQIDRMDQGIGKIMNALRANGYERNTIVIFLSDNGGCAEVITEQWPESLHMPYKTSFGEEVTRGFSGDMDLLGTRISYDSYGMGWANVSDTPFKYYKHYIHEGGISTPFIISWHDVLPKGVINHSPHHIIDVMPTCLEAAGVAYPDSCNGIALHPLEGQSILSGDDEVERIFCWEHHGNKGVMKGDWKLVKAAKSEWELYNLKNDRSEVNNLLLKHPEIVDDLKEIYESWAKRVGVVDNIGKNKKNKKNNLNKKTL